MITYEKTFSGDANVYVRATRLPHELQVFVTSVEASAKLGSLVYGVHSKYGITCTLLVRAEADELAERLCKGLVKRSGKNVLLGCGVQHADMVDILQWLTSVL